MPRTNAQPPGRWGRTPGESAAPSCRTRGGDSPFSSPGGRGSLVCRSWSHPRAQGFRGRAAGPPFSTDSSPPSCPSPRALADLAGAGALHSEARGGAGPPRHCSTETRAPSPRPGPRAGARGPFLVSGWTRSYSVPRRPPKPPPPPHSPPWSRRVWLGVPLSLFPSSLSCPLSSLSYVSVSCLSFPICVPFLCPVISSPSALPFLVQSFPYLS